MTNSNNDTDNVITPHISSDGIATASNAIELLKADHRQVEAWLAQFDTTNSSAINPNLVARICKAIEVHSQVEEELVYPAFLETVGHKDMHHMAINAHDDARDTIAEIRSLPRAASQESLDVLIHALAELLRQHVNEEEKRGGMFDQMTAARVDLFELGARIERRKLELMHDDASTDRSYDEAAHLDGRGQV